MYTTVVIDYTACGDVMNKKIQEQSNTMQKNGYELVNMTVLSSKRAILLYKN